MSLVSFLDPNIDDIRQGQLKFSKQQATKMLMNMLSLEPFQIHNSQDKSRNHYHTARFEKKHKMLRFRSDS